MEKRTLLLFGIPVGGTLIAANLLYFWLAPDVEAKMVVYIFCLLVVLVQGAVSGTLWHFFGAEKATPTVVCGTAFALGVLVAGCVMLALEAPFRMALYFLLIFSLLYVICVGYLSCIAADELWNHAETTMLEFPSVRHPLHEWLQNMRATFRRRRPGETDAERHVRNNREIHPDPPAAPVTVQSGPPPLPGRHE